MRWTGEEDETAIICELSLGASFAFSSAFDCGVQVASQDLLFVHLSVTRQKQSTRKLRVFAL
jgi:hypothetical protein